MLVLASASPRRQQYMHGLGLEVEVHPADVDETPHKNELPTDYVLRVATDKASAVATGHTGKTVLAADTTVWRGRQIIGKPETAEEAAHMLRLLAGARHRVSTAVVVVDKDGHIKSKVVTTRVKMRRLSEKQIQAYVAQPENWKGVAGGYGIQTPVGSSLVAWVNGSVSNVVGLPLVETLNLLRSCGHDV